MEKQKIIFIVNPFSGTSSKTNIDNDIKQYIDGSRFKIEITKTTHPNHAAEIALEAKVNNVDIVVAVGGDGTVNEVASSLKGGQTALGVIPGGSGNGFAMHLGMGRNIKKALKSINSCKPIFIDTCTINGEFFTNVAGLGFDARIAYLTKKNKVRGLWQYIKTSIYESRKYQPLKIIAESEMGKVEGSYTSATIANASMFGYYFTVAPMASLIDSHMDVVMIKKASIFRYLLESYRFFTRSLDKSNLTDVIRCTTLKIRCDDDCHYHVDGEGRAGGKSYIFKIYPQSLKVLVPPHRLPHQNLV